MGSRKIEKHFGFNKAKYFWEISQDAKKEVISRMKLHNIDCDFSTGIINATINRKDTNNLFDEVNNLKKIISIQKFKNSHHLNFQQLLIQTSMMVVA